MSNVKQLQVLLPVFLDNCKTITQLNQIHALLTTSGLSQCHSFAFKLLNFASLSDTNYAERFFVHLQNPTVFHYNALIRGYSNTKNPSKSIYFFIQMLRNGIIPSHLTYPFVIKGSAKLLQLKLGECVHGHALRNGYVVDLFVSNSLVHMYAGAFGDIGSGRMVFGEMSVRNLVSWNTMLDGYGKVGNVAAMREVFDEMKERDVVSWSSLIDGYVKAGDFIEALAVFERMRTIGPMANEVTMVSVLCACAHLGALQQGRMMHSYIVENGLPLTLVLRTSLVDMYAKCGAIEEALEVFRGVSIGETDVLIWNAVIGGFATHGYTKESLEMCGEMYRSSVKPDEITYLCLLSACAHGGLVKEAFYFFESISKDGLMPTTEHYACMVDVLSREGRITEAYQFMCEMPMKPTASVLGALLNGCMNHRRLDIAEIVGRKLIEIDPGHDGRYVGLSNVYAVVKRWEEVKTTRETMETRGLRKFPGLSSFENSGTLHSFRAHDETHPESEDIFFMLNLVFEQMKLKADLKWQEYCVYCVDVM